MLKNFALSKEKIYNKFHVSPIKERTTSGGFFSATKINYLVFVIYFDSRINCNNFFHIS